MNLVAGATGLLGGEICRRLTAAGKPVRAMARATSDPAKVKELDGLGAEIVTADLKDPASLASACRGATTVISGVTAIFPQQPGDSISSVDHDGQVALVDAALAAGVANFVYISFTGNLEDFPLSSAKRAVERHLAQSGLAYTVLRPSYFMEVWLGPPLGFDVMAGRVRVFGSGDQRLSWISLGDVAAFVVACVDNPDARNKTIELGGPDALSPGDVIQMVEDIGGKPVQVEYVPVEALEDQRRAATNEFEESLSALMLGQTNGDVIDMSGTLAEFPVRLRPVHEYVGAVLRA